MGYFRQGRSLDSLGFDDRSRLRIIGGLFNFEAEDNTFCVISLLIYFCDVAVSLNSRCPSGRA